MKGDVPVEYVSEKDNLNYKSIKSTNLTLKL